MGTRKVAISLREMKADVVWTWLEQSCAKVAIRVWRLRKSKQELRKEAFPSRAWERENANLFTTLELGDEGKLDSLRGLSSCGPKAQPVHQPSPEEAEGLRRAGSCSPADRKVCRTDNSGRSQHRFRMAGLTGLVHFKGPNPGPPASAGRLWPGLVEWLALRAE